MKTQKKTLPKRSEAKIPSYERGANAEQLEVIRHENGPCRVISCAGSGKTFSLVRRVVRLVEKLGVDGKRICAMTFSTKAAGEMNKRLVELGVDGARVGTWHSLCLQILREDKTEYGDWEIDDKNKAKYVLKDTLGYKQMNWAGSDLMAVNRFIGNCKANLFAPDSSEALDLANASFGWQAQKAVQAFSLYNENIYNKALLTFDDFLVFAAEHLRSSEDVRLHWASKFDYLLCDEVQDNNNAQSTLAHLLAKDHNNFMAIGDCFQAIFGFRGSSPSYLANFETHWPGAKTIVLPRNYRSGKKIIDAANAIVNKASVPGLTPTNMIGERPEDGEVRVLCTEALDDEANEVANAIASSVDSESSTYSEHTIIFRLNAQSRAVEEALLARRIPYVVVGGVSFYERKEVRDMLAYLRLAAGTGRVDDIKRSINTPFRFLGAKFVERLMNEVDKGDLAVVDWPAAVERVSNFERIQARQRASASSWSDMIRTMQKMIADGADEEASDVAREDARPSKLLEYVINTTKYIDWLMKEEGDETVENSGPANVREMIRVAERFPNTHELLDYIDKTIAASKKQRDDKEAGGERVVLMTVHKCVSPDTLVETTEGLMRIEEVPFEGCIGTVLGAMPYKSKVSFENRRMLRITTKSGYLVEVTEDHGMMSWDGKDYARKEASDLEIGDWLRLRLGAGIDPETEVELPAAPDADVRSRRYAFPKRLTSQVAELFGLVVADATVYKAGLRLRKRHQDVVERFRDLLTITFGCGPDVEEFPLKDGRGVYWGCEVNSVQIASWFLSMNGFAPKAKGVPTEVLRSPLRVQASFLRGLFEDGTVNMKGDRLDHVALSTCYERVARDVQTMLLRLGIISARKMYAGQWRVAVYGANAKRFGEKVGFVSEYKNALIQSSRDVWKENYSVPVNKSDFLGGEACWGDRRFAAQNAAGRGSLGRASAAKMGLDEALSFHHEKIASIESYEGPAMCLEVPDHGRFLQNGFDGCNSKGLEYPFVYVIGMNELVLPHVKGDPEEERRLAYVAATRAQNCLTLSYVRRIATRTGVKVVSPSRFLLDAFPHAESPLQGLPNLPAFLAGEPDSAG